MSCDSATRVITWSGERIMVSTNRSTKCKDEEKKLKMTLLFHHTDTYSYLLSLALALIHNKLNQIKLWGSVSVRFRFQPKSFWATDMVRLGQPKSKTEIWVFFFWPFTRACSGGSGFYIRLNVFRRDDRRFQQQVG